LPDVRPAQQRPSAPLPTKTAKNYLDKQWAEVPFSSLPHSALVDYLAYYTERLPTLTQANHRASVEATIAAAEVELEKRREAEAAGADAETGELPDQEVGAPFLADPSEDPAHEHAS
jgi:hypothetical protein